MLHFEVLLLFWGLAILLFLWRVRPARERFLRCVEVDTRSLAAFRGILGLLIVLDGLLRLRNFEAFYSEAGAVPRTLAVDLLPRHAFSVFLLSGDDAVTFGLFALHLLVGVLLLVGYRTTFATVISFVLVASLDYRNPLVLSYADNLFVLLLFWATFLPLGERWSIDALRRSRAPRSAVANVATAFVLVQVVSMYFVNATHKAESELWSSGDAMVLVLGLDDITFLLGDVVRHFPELLQFAGLTWYYMVWLSPLLFVLVGRSRAAFAALFVLGHLSLAVTVRIGAFSFVSIAGLVLFFQTSAVDALAARLSAYDVTLPEVDHPVIDRLVRADRRLPRLRANAISYGEHLDGSARILVTALLLTAGASMTIDNLQRAGIAGDGHELTLQGGVDAVNEVFRINQPSWTIFAPEPRTVDYYYVFPAKTSSGRHLDVYNGRPVTYDRPYRQLNRQYPTYRHRFYMNSIRESALDGGRSDAHRYLAAYYCDTWRGPNGTTLRYLNMYVVRERVTVETVDAPADRERRATLLYRHACDSADRPTVIQPPPADLVA